MHVTGSAQPPKLNKYLNIPSLQREDPINASCKNVFKIKVTPDADLKLKDHIENSFEESNEFELSQTTPNYLKINLIKPKEPRMRVSRKLKQSNFVSSILKDREGPKVDLNLCLLKS
jgi:hypothetical protein